MILGVLSIYFVLLDFALLNYVIERPDTAVSIIDHALKLHGQVSFRCQLLALLLHVHRDGHESFLGLHLVDLRRLDASIVDLLAHLSLELEVAQGDDFFSLLNVALFVVIETLLKLFYLTIERVFMILHLFSQVVQLVDLDLYV